MTDSHDQWSWKKFFGGFIDGRNYAKSIVLMFCMIVILIICFSVYSLAKSYIKKPTPTDTSTLSGQTVTQNIDKSVKEVKQTNYPFANGLFGWANKAEGTSNE